ncbi:MAG: hypothetical protein GX358_01500 [candidate division WS1 bacterium]|jgi:hypothetical protein|nr:hypothetical protein [candidate division WS1 bacterium]
MKQQSEQEQLIAKASAYLKSHYGEDTVRMDVLDNRVEGGSGTLQVECTVSVGGSHSDWQKTFYFDDGRVVNMSYRFLR